MVPILDEHGCLFSPLFNFIVPPASSLTPENNLLYCFTDKKWKRRDDSHTLPICLYSLSAFFSAVMNKLPIHIYEQPIIHSSTALYQSTSLYQSAPFASCIVSLSTLLNHSHDHKISCNTILLKTNKTWSTHIPPDTTRSLCECQKVGYFCCL